MSRAMAVVDFLVQARLENFPAAVVNQAKLALKDALGVALAGSKSRAARVVREFTTLFPMSPAEATLWGQPGRTSCLWAAWANAMAASSLDADDGHRRPLGHPGAVIVPAAVAAAERAGASGRQLLEGLIVGYEIGLRAGMFINRRHDQYYHGSGTWGGLGAAAAGAKILGLDGESCLNALGLAEGHVPLSLIMGWIEMRRPPEIKEGIGWGSLVGLSAALLAECGLLGTFSLADQAEGEVLTRGLGQDYQLLRLYFKGFPACRWTHAAIEGALKARAEHALKPEEVTRITVATHAKACRLDSARPRTIEEAEYSLPFLVGAALVHGRVGPAEVSQAGLADPAVLSLAERVKVELDPGLDAEYPQKTMACLEITTATGQKITILPRDRVSGDYQTPFTPEQLDQKFRAFAGHCLPAEAVARLSRSLAAVEDLAKVTELTQLLAIG